MTYGDTTEGGTTCGVPQEGGTTCGVPRVIPPRLRHPPSSVVSPRRVGQHVVSPVSSPLARIIPPSVWCLLGGVGQHVVSPRRGDNMWCPPCRVIPPPVWCLPGGWDNMWYPRVSSPLAPSPASSPLQCGVSQEGGTTCGIPVRPPSPTSPLIISRDMSSPRCFK